MVRARNLWNCFVRSSLARYLHRYKRSRHAPAPYADKVEVLQVSPLRVKVTYRLLPLALSSSLSSVVFRVVLSYGHSCSPSLPPARTSRAGSLSWRIETLLDVIIHLLRDQTPWKFCQHFRRVKIFISIKRKINISSKICHISNRKIIIIKELIFTGNIPQYYATG